MGIVQAVSAHDAPHFPRGFLFAGGETSAPDSFQPSAALPHLYLHPWTSAEAADDGDLFVVVIGTAVSMTPGFPAHTARELLTALQSGEHEFFEVLAWLSGRHAVIFGDSRETKIVSDATTMRSLYYAKDDAVVSSHASLVEKALGNTPKRERFPFQFGFPGNRTPYPNVKLLTPNTYLNVTRGTVHRFWPTAQPRPRNVDDVAQAALRAGTEAMRNISRGRVVNVALTAGLDSRVMLAISLNSGVEFQTYTYGHDWKTAIDRDIAQKLAKAHGVRHSLVPRPPLSGGLKARLAEAHFTSHHASAVPGLVDWFNNPRSVSMTGNLLEIGRSFFTPNREAGVRPPTTPETMMALHRERMHSRTQERIGAYGEHAWEKRALEAFEGFFDDSDFAKTVDLIDPFDLFYWEHRMSAWHGASMVERDFYAEPFIPLNARGLFEMMLGIAEPKRIEGAVFYRMIEMVEPELLRLPVNPKRWPISS